MYTNEAHKINDVSPEETLQESVPGDRPWGEMGVAKLRGQHERILELASLGYRQVDIANELGISSQTVSNLMRSSLGKARMAELNADRKARFDERAARLDALADSALSVYEDVFLGHEPLDPRDKVKVAADVLDRAGLPKTSRSEKTTMRATLTAEQIREINARAEGLTINLTPIPIVESQ